MTLSELDALPQVQINAKEHGKAHLFEGALLGDVLSKVGAPAGKAIRGEELADVVIIEARDGYKIALDLAARYRRCATNASSWRIGWTEPHWIPTMGRFSSLWRAICAQRAPSAWFSPSASNVFGEARFGSPFTRR